MDRSIRRHRRFLRSTGARKPPGNEKLLQRHKPRTKIRAQRQRHAELCHTCAHAVPVPGCRNQRKRLLEHMQLIKRAAEACQRTSQHHRAASLSRVLPRAGAKQHRREHKPCHPFDRLHPHQLPHPVAGGKKARKNRAQAVDRQKYAQQPQRAGCAHVSNPVRRSGVAQEKQQQPCQRRDQRACFQAAFDCAAHAAGVLSAVFLGAKIHCRHAKTRKPQRHGKAADRQHQLQKPQPSRTDGASQIALKKHGHAAQQQLNQRQQQRV